jgi:MFS family permease
MRLKSLLRSLSNRNFRLFFFGQGFSLIGTWMQQIAMSWLVFQLTHSSFKLGLVLFLANIPSLLLSPFIGVLIDRWNRHHVILLTQSLSMVQAFVLAFLGLTGTIAIWQVYVLSLFLGVVNAFDITARQTFTPEMISRREDLGNAIALNSSMFNVARLIGPSLAGLLLAVTSPSICFLANGITYLAVLAALLAMRLPTRPIKESPYKSLHSSLLEGMHHVVTCVPLRNILLLAALGSIAGSSYVVLLPEFTVKILHGNASTLGLLSASTGCGSLAGALFLATRKSVLGLGKWIALGSIIMGLGLVGLSQTSHMELSAALLAAVGYGMIVQMAASNTLLQTISDEDKRGRVLSFYTLAFIGMAPIGSLFTGYLSSTFDTSLAFQLNGFFSLLGGVFFALELPRMREAVRQTYVRLKILP